MLGKIILSLLLSLFGFEMCSAKTNNLKIISFNIGGDFIADGPNQWKNRKPLIMQFISKESPDILCMQEVLINQLNETIELSIRNTLAKYFLNIDSTTLFIAKSELISTILDNNSDIQAIDLDIISEYAEEAYFNKFYIKYELVNTNNIYTYNEIKEVYENSVYPGLDSYGNISLNSKLEIPILKGGFNYYPDKESNSKDSYRVPDIQVYFI